MQDEIEQMRNQIHRLMGKFFQDVKPLGYQHERCFHPPMDIFETQDDLMMVIEIAGVKKEDIHVLFEKDVLSIYGTREEFSSSPKIRHHQMEIDYGCFERQLQIPFPCKTDEIKATYRHGFLTVTIPKRKESISKTVEVNLR